MSSLLPCTAPTAAGGGLTTPELPAGHSAARMGASGDPARAQSDSHVWTPGWAPAPPSLRPRRGAGIWGRGPCWLDLLPSVEAHAVAQGWKACGCQGPSLPASPPRLLGSRRETRGPRDPCGGSARGRGCLGIPPRPLGRHAQASRGVPGPRQCAHSTAVRRG